MQIGAIFPTTEIGSDPSVIRDWAQTAEGLGYDYILTFDHVLGAEHARREPKFMGPYTEQHPFHEPFTLFSYLAGLTRSIELATGVIILPQRQTALVAKQAAELDILSGGRLRLGVGTGWNHAEYQALGVPYAGRGKRLDEQIEVLRKLWTEDLVDFSGDYHRIDRANILPRPSRPIPIWFGAIQPVALRRAVALGDGLLLAAMPTMVEPMVDQALELLEAGGRDRAGFGLEASVDFSQGPDAWQAELELWRDKGGTHLSLRAMDTGAAMMGLSEVGYAGPQAYIDALETFKKAIG
jgi:probable F420-dependent oxidoreductase